ncbi:MAG: hypothetical protein ACJA2G_001858 [Cognaticolwellia sp.]|jgi:hypothetical protein
MKRRQFITSIGAVAAITAVGVTNKVVAKAGVNAGAKKVHPPFGKKHWKKSTFKAPEFKQKCLTQGPNNHFFGYFGMSPWSHDETKLVCLESHFHDRMPDDGETAKIGLVNQQSGKFTTIGETTAWNLQQGAMIHWNPLQPNDEIIFNNRSGKHFHASILNINTGKVRDLPRSIHAVASTGKYALSLTEGRLSRMRKVVGYSGAKDPNPNDPFPVNDGIFRIDIATGESNLILSIAAVFNLSIKHYPALEGRDMWFNHTVISPNGQRFAFLARTRTNDITQDKKIDSAMFSSNIDGTDLKMIIPFGTGVSHFGWRGNNEIVATFIKPGDDQIKHYIINDSEFINIAQFKVLGDGFIINDGHCTFDPSTRFLATDRKETERLSQSLWLYDMEQDAGMMLAAHPAGQYSNLHGDTRCDFHPRWSPSGKKVCYDAIDSRTWTRQLQIIKFS